MKVQRTEIYDFTVILTEYEFNVIARIAGGLNLNMEQALVKIIGVGLINITKANKQKEKKDVVDG